MLFVTPEYIRSIPGGLKNAIDWASRPYGDELVHPQALGGHRRLPGGSALVAQQSLVASRIPELAVDERDQA